ncbi:hypothetical protein DWW69_10885 [Bacteroides sp. AF16-49]|jgi:hypothetical protein|nr:hypothetical protein DXB63_06005 [Bacteroides sp. OM05-12]RHR75129.1 hypothetical protein DWW69_10885 [Bacteroides sp. AF16-49]DAU20782.1 MAG TPA: hypothetical protein [Caudoviricetes sp.]
MSSVDDNLLAVSITSALKVEFLSSSEELFLYANALYFATMWGREVDERNKAIQERDKSVK